MKSIQNEMQSCYGISRLTADFLIKRGFTLEDAGRLFFGLEFRPFAKSSLAKEASKASQLLRSAENVGLFCDYDADGMMSSETLRVFMEELKKPHEVYIPERAEHYGLSRKAVRKFHQKDVDLLITADCGSSDHDAVEYAKTLGMSVIVTDHHEYTSRPPSDAFLNSVGTEYASLCGCAVAGMTFQELSAEAFAKAFPYMAVATIGDIVPLFQESRILVSEFLKSPRFPGVLEAAFQDVAGISINSIAFQVVPKINALSRMGCARDLFKIRRWSALRAAKHLTLLNSKRKLLQKEISQSTLNAADTSTSVIVARVPEKYKDVVGFYGLIASRLTEEFQKPSLVGQVINGRFKGSGRSPGHVHLHRLLTKASETLDLDFGGHSAAVGFSAKDEGALRDHASFLLDEFSNEFSKETPDTYDFTASVADLQSFEDVYSELAPFGAGLLPPIIRVTDLQFTKYDTDGFFATILRNDVCIRVIGQDRDPFAASDGKLEFVDLRLQDVQDGRLAFDVCNFYPRPVVEKKTYTRKRTYYPKKKQKTTRKLLEL